MVTQEICGLRVSKLSRSLLSRFSSEFREIRPSELVFANGGQVAIDRRSFPKENVLIASAFGIISIITRRNNVDESAASWLIEKLDKLELVNSDESGKLENEAAAATNSSSTSSKMHGEIKNEVTDKGQVNFANETQSQDEVHVKNKSGAKMEEKEDPSSVLRHLEDIFASIASNSNDPAIKDRLSAIANELVAQRGVKAAFENLLGDDAVKNYFESLRVPDWILLYLKLESRLSDEGWQNLINLTQLGRTGVSTLTVDL